MTQQDFLSQIKQHQRIIIKLVNVYARDDEERKDFSQEILYQAWKNINGFQHQAKFSTWLYRVCLNTIFTLKRKTNRVDYHDNLEPMAPMISEESQRDAIEQLRAAMHVLRESEQVILTMHLEGYDNDEIAGIMGVTSNNIGVKIYRIKKELETILKHEIYGYK